MLKLDKITKTYVSGDEKVEALKGISLEFRDAEFVSILGPSGCGKTTLLNIIGGLDKYTTGDLIINNKSTKEFKDRDWDAYRNYSVGFVFQSYNLIPHQTVLANVELALTLSGVSKKERKEKAIKSLEDVGLKDQIHKKPNQLSGGQMQRVAIARALVNNPDIILADEPTGALDTKTSTQVMEILKKISKNKLIIMVTHNPDIAEKYSSRIIKILDGKITDDSNPLNKEEKSKEKVEKAKYRRTSMKFFTAFRLSLNNLMTKKGRTFLTSFAGSIGIIGIALILAISTGVQNYIDKVEEDTLSSYPLNIQKSSVDMSSMITAFMGEVDTEGKIREEGKIYSLNIMDAMISAVSNKVQNNNLTELKSYLDSENNEIVKNSNAIEYSYDLNLNLYKYEDEEVLRVNPSSVMDSIGMGRIIEAENSTIMSMGGSTTMTTMSTSSVWTKLLDNEKLLKSQYDLVAGAWPENYNEVVLIVTKNNEINDYALYSLGLKDQNNLKDKMKKIQNGEKIEESEDEVSYDVNDILKLRYKLLLNSDYYEKENGAWLDKSDSEEFIKSKLENAEEIKIVGIIKANDQSAATTRESGIGYLKDLEEYVINKSNESEIVKEQKENNEINVFSGLKFPSGDESFDITSLSTEQRMALMRMSAEDISKIMQAYSENKDASYETNLIKLGAIDLNSPSMVSIYPKDFEGKEKITKAIEDYNKMQKDSGKEENAITYSDIIGTMIKSVSNIIDTISYVLIAFVAISLIVSSIMIGIITYISVLERTKEIGILRSIGASKRDISTVFNAETLIVGLISGIIGIGITMLLTIPINSIIYSLTGVVVKTVVPALAGVILVAISVVLTVIAGLIPAKFASRRDPVIALRTE